VNAAFLRRLAAAGGGACELVESEDRLDDVMAKVHRRIATPVVTELALRGEGLALDAATVAPQRIPALFVGAPVVIAARVIGRPVGGAITVTGRTPSGQPWSQTIPVRVEEKGDAAAAMWARARIRDLEDVYAVRSHGKAELEQQIVAVSLRHRVLSRFTAFVAIDRAEKVNIGGNPRPVIQPVEAPAGWNMTRAGVAPPAAAYAMAPPPMGAPMAVLGAPGMPAPAQAPTGAPRGGGGGLFQKAKDLFKKQEAAMPPPPAPKAPMKSVMLGGGLRDAKEEPSPAADAMPYQKRAREIADAIDRAADASDRRALDLALARLVELEEDVRSVGGLDDLAASLDAVIATLRGLVASPTSAPDEWRAVATELRAPAKKAGGRAFWK
jgi:Ca-activated chloride channel family protein